MLRSFFGLGQHGRESARKAPSVAAAHEGSKHPKWSRATQILMSSVVHDILPRAVKNVCGLVGWGGGRRGAAAS